MAHDESWSTHGGGVVVAVWESRTVERRVHSRANKIQRVTKRTAIDRILRVPPHKLMAFSELNSCYFNILPLLVSKQKLQMYSVSGAGEQN
jgi:hypothetical protein